jgi:histidinol-phosphate aminotransferase
MTEPLADVVPVPRIRRLASAPPRPVPVDLGTSLPLRSLHLNESPFPPAPRVVAAMQAAAAALNRYPDHDGRELIAALAARNDVPADRLVIGAGSSELLYASAETALDAGDEAIAPVPGFPPYAKIIALRGATYVGVPVRRQDGVVDVDAILASVTPRTRLVYVTTPQNPTGGLLEPEAIERLVEALPEDLLLHFDEAYYEFGRHAGAPPALPVLARRKAPWIVTRSFSKAYGLAGVRIGYGIASSATIADAFRKIRAGFSVNAIALAGARAALDEEEHVAALLDHTRVQRLRLAEGLSRLGFRPLPSAANFLAAIAPRPATELAAALTARNIFVLPFAWPESPGALRITIGTQEDTDAVIAALAESLAAR